MPSYFIGTSTTGLREGDAVGQGVRGTPGRTRRLAGACAVVMVATALLAPARTRLGAQFTTRGLNIAPVFEGWEPNTDGSFNLVFGYFNRNWEGELDLPAGPNNSIQPGGPDQGQPTHFYPRRTRFLFRVRVSADFGKKELIWTLTVNGKTERAYATLHPDYIIDGGVVQANNGDTSFFMNPNNRPPSVKVEGDQTRRVKVGLPLTLKAIATDDGIPKAKPMRPPGSFDAGIPQGATGLRLSWLVYRAAGKVTFDPPQFSAWEDDRDGKNSPYSPGWIPPSVPPANTWVARTTFGEAGTYVLRALAHDGAFTSEADITIIVTP